MLRHINEAIEQHAHVLCDICVIGGGIAGLLTAVEASRSGQRVVVLESGSHKPTPSLDLLNEVEHEHEHATYQTALTGRTRVLGGTSTIWGGRLMPLTAHDMSARHHVGLPSWPCAKAELDQHLASVERLFSLDHSAYNRLPGRSDLPENHQDLTTRWAKWPLFWRRNVAHVLRQTIARTSNLDILLGATACEFDLDEISGRLKGVAARSLKGHSVYVGATSFVVACGTLETTRLLLQLDATNRNRVFEGCDALGRYFHDHLAVEVGRLHVNDPSRVNRTFGYFVSGATRRSLHLESTPAAQREDRAASGYVTVRPEFNARSLHAHVRNIGRAVQEGRWRETIPRLGLFRGASTLAPAAYWRWRHGQMYFGPNVDLFLDARVEQVPSALSRLTLGKQRDAFGTLQLRIDWRKSADDAHTLRCVLRRAQRYWNTTFLGEAACIDWNSALSAEATALLAKARDTRHPSGTARMGTDRHSSVVDADLRCHAVPNLYVVSAAVFPSSGSSNPTLTIMQLAMRAGAMLASKSSSIPELSSATNRSSIRIMDDVSQTPL